MTTPLGRKIRQIIRHNGPMSVADYFALCLGDPRHGYYRTRDPFGAQGDFVTAPEISQLFGELIGIFMILTWQSHGRPAPLRLVELGPGRGTLMADMQRVISDLQPAMAQAASFHLVETSEPLRGRQREKLSPLGLDNHWHDRIEDVPPDFTLLVGNEFFDALPIRQFVLGPDGYRERVVAISDGGDLVFANGLATLDRRTALPEEAIEGTIIEISPARESVMATLSERLKQDGGAAILIDYGFLEGGTGDTLQAVRAHLYEEVLASPGEADLTSHVDFAALAHVARSRGLTVAPPLTQSQFLLGLGLLERAGALGRDKPPDVQNALSEAVNRLAGVGDGQMGNLFKVLYTSTQPTLPAPFETAD